MILYSCAREKELAGALHDGTWPYACDAELRAHVAACQECNDLVLVTQTLRQARVESALAAPLPPAGLLWWRAQLRRRNAALERMNQPVVLTGKLALLCTAAVALGLGLWNTDQVSEWLHWFGDLSSSDAFRLNTLVSASSVGGWMSSVLIVSLGVVVILGGVAAYLLADRE